VAAVLIIDDQKLYTDGAPTPELLARFKKRGDNQITSTEMLSISLGLATFAPELSGRKVVVYSDNRGAEAATAKGSAKEWDHCKVVHEIWTQVGIPVLLYVRLWRRLRVVGPPEQDAGLDRKSADG